MVGLPGVGVFDRQPRHQQRQHGKYRDDHREVAKPFERRLDRDHLPEAEIDEREGAKRAKDHPGTRRRHRVARSTARSSSAELGSGSRRPRKKRERQDPDHVVDAAGPVQALQNSPVADRQDHETDDQPDRQTAVGRPPRSCRGPPARRPMSAAHTRNCWNSCSNTSGTDGS